MSSRKQSHWKTVADSAVLLALGLVFLKNYWLSEDAYLNFRSVQQLLEGRGPIWNPHERAQVFTSPLWFWLHALVQGAVREVHLAVLLLSGMCFAAMLWWLRRCVGGGFAFALAGLLLVGCGAVFDYTSSGQENVLGFVLVLWAVSSYWRLSETPTALFSLFAAAGGILTCRHDLCLLCAPLIAHAAWTHRRALDARAWTLLTAALLGPLAAWSLFSLFYYGTPFPNPAYAKLSAGFPRAVYLARGLEYLEVLLRHDTLSAAVLALALALLAWQRAAASLSLAAALVLHVGYVVYVGGDYMQGRFVSYDVLIACALLARTAPSLLEGSLRAVVPLALLAYALTYPRTPLNTSFAQPKPRDGVRDPGREYVMDARSTLGVYTSFYSYLRATDLRQYPEHPLAIEGRKLARSTQPVAVVQAGGMFGWAAGTQKIIVEAHGICDPLLARLPASAFRGIGHYTRYRPEGYLDGLAKGHVKLEDRDLDAYYQKLALITQGPLWSAERLQTILRFNLGAYDRLVDHFVHEKIDGTSAKKNLP
jgi:arabinofuranosyltransferase